MSVNSESMPPPFNAEAYWADKPRKTWVVILETGGRKNAKRQTLYCSAKTSKGAIKTAVANSYLKGRLFLVSVRLATPTDLGCTWTAAKFSST